MTGSGHERSATVAAPDSVNVPPSKHSPGPWELVEGSEHHGPYVVNLYGGDVCDCYVMSNPFAPSRRNGGNSDPVLFADAEANARLIAAAPDLLEALVALYLAPWKLDCLAGGDEQMAASEKARAAIAKATGAAS